MNNNWMSWKITFSFVWLRINLLDEEMATYPCISVIWYNLIYYCVPLHWKLQFENFQIVRWNYPSPRSKNHPKFGLHSTMCNWLICMVHFKFRCQTIHNTINTFLHGVIVTICFHYTKYVFCGFNYISLHWIHQVLALLEVFVITCN